MKTVLLVTCTPYNDLNDYVTYDDTVAFFYHTQKKFFVHGNILRDKNIERAKKEEKSQKISSLADETFLNVHRDNNSVEITVLM